MDNDRHFAVRNPFIVSLQFGVHFQWIPRIIDIEWLKSKLENMVPKPWDNGNICWNTQMPWVDENESFHRSSHFLLMSLENMDCWSFFTIMDYQIKIIQLNLPLTLNTDYFHKTNSMLFAGRKWLPMWLQPRTKLNWSEDNWTNSKIHNKVELAQMFIDINRQYNLVKSDKQPHRVNNKKIVESSVFIFQTVSFLWKFQKWWTTICH